LQGWILFHRELDPALPEVPEVLRFCEAAQSLNLQLHVLNPHDFDIVVGVDESWNVKYQGRQVDRPEFILCRTGAETDYFTLALLRHFERRGIRLVNSSTAIEMVADKLHTMQCLARAGLPVPRTILSKFPIDSGLVESELGFPVIVKTLKGTRGAGVLKCEDRSQFEDLAGLLESAGAEAEFILQHYVRASHGRDVRLLVVGGRVVAAMERRSLTGGFKSNVSLGGIGEAVNPPPEMAELAVRAADVLTLDVTGIDVLYDEDGYRICEANSAPGFQGLERASGIDIPSIILEWVRASHGAQVLERETGEGEALIDLVYGGRARLRSLADVGPSLPRFAQGSGVRLIAAGLSCLSYAALPRMLRDHRSGSASALQALFDGRLPGAVPASMHADQETAFLIVIGVAIWAALVPWLAGAGPAAAGTLSLVAMMFPLIVMLTAPVRRRPPQEQS
jgi:gamma-F420-2:alpha-L-glutamate ligase